MMGSYCYYDTSFIEDVSADLHIHDCMWSGECYSCQPARVTFSGAPVGPVLNGTVPITVGGSGLITLTQGTNQDLNKRQVWPDKQIHFKLSEKSPLTSSESSIDVADTPEPSTPPPPPPPPLATQPKHQVEKRQTRVSLKKSNAPKSSHSTSSDNKKLRHREVEKNRHRQLQAMVKTLSEKIPGKLDKETQVQTMKRAARYCLYLRETISVLSHGTPNMFKDKLEKIYLRSCDNVELIMSQDMSGR